MALNPPVTLARQFGKIILTLENCLLPVDKLVETPSHHDGLDRQTEVDLRILGCELIQTAGILLKLPQVAMATGQVLFQRFYYSKSFVRHGMETTAMSCVCLASKIEEAPRRIRDVINVFAHIKQVRAQRPIQPMILDAVYISLKTQIIKAERRVLKELGFCVHVKHPHKLIVMYLQVLGYEKNQKLMQFAWNYMNDSLRTDAFVRFSPETIACACIYLTARKLNFPLPNNPPWFAVFKVTEDDIVNVSYRIAELYRRTKPNAEALELAVELLRKKYLESRQRSRPGGQGTPPAVTTTVDRSNGGHNAWGGFISRTLPVTTVPGGLAVSNLAVGNNSNATNANDSAAKGAAAGKRSHTRSRSRSHSRSPNDDGRSRNRKKSRNRSPVASSRYANSGAASGAAGGTNAAKKKSSRNYSRSPSSSPHNSKPSRKRSSRKSPGRNASGGGGGDYYSNGSGGVDRDRVSSKDRSDRPRESRGKDRTSGSGGGGGRGERDDRSKHDRYATSRSSSHRTAKHRERSRERSGDRSRDRKR